MTPHASNKTSTATATLAASLSIFFGALKIINFFSIKYYYFYQPKIINITIFSPSIDLGIWTASLILVATIVLTMQRRFSKETGLLLLLTIGSILLATTAFEGFSVLGVFAGLVATGLWLLKESKTSGRNIWWWMLLCLSVIFLVFETAAFETWIWNAIDYSFPFASAQHWQFALFDLQIFNVFYSWTAGIFVLFLFSWIWIPLGKFLASKINWPKLAILIKAATNAAFEPKKIGRKTLWAGLLATVVAGAFVAYYPYFHLSDSVLIGTDSTYYVSWLEDMHQQGPLSALSKDRPVSHLLMYGIETLTQTTTQTTVRIMPVIFAACLALAVFGFVKTGTDNDQLALVSSGLTAFSFQITVSVYIYSLSNWLALSEAFILFALLMKNKQTQRWKYTALAALTGALMLLTHPYTWEVVMILLLTYFVWTSLRVKLQKKTREKSELKNLVFILGANITFYVAYALLPLGAKVGEAGGEVFNYLVPYFGLANFANLLTGLENMVQVWAGGLLANPVLATLALLGAALAFSKLGKQFNRLLAVFVAVPSLSLLAFAPDSFFFYRIIYMIPLQVFAAIGLTGALSMFTEAADQNSDKNNLGLKIVIVALVVLLLFNYALRSVDGAPIHILST